jgi:hypothetical protein
MEERVNIPVLELERLSEGVTEKVKWSGCWKCRFKHVGGLDRKIRLDINSEM